MKALILLCSATLLAACTHSTAPAPTRLSGEVYYLQRIALPPDATLDVRLLDVSLADAPARTLAQHSGPIRGNVPLPFELSIDPAQRVPRHQYAVSARILQGDRLLFISTERNSVQLDGSDVQPLRIKVEPVR